ncbi:pilus assembly protein PilM [Aquibacillus albus]|uniref:Type IV pilus assembly protein PilM n=1 Tax=Aquibacillus albus TaxID=1168171 RepID=A0ABS2N1K7_9BACI|nr:type IV pilus assembly protein PilM [Aquibacillus albus]
MNLIIKDQVIRYVVSTGSSFDDVIDYGERFFQENIIEDGKIINEKAFNAVLDRLIRDKKWKNKPLYFCVPDAAISIREQMVPKGLTKDEIKQYIMMELDESIRLPFTNPAIDFEIIGEEDEQTKILLFAYPKERLESYVNLFVNLGLKPIVADISSLSIFRLYFTLDLPSAKEHLLSVQWDKDSIVLTAFNQNKPVFTRYIKSSLDAGGWTWDVQENELIWSDKKISLEAYEEEQLTKVERFMDFYQYSVMHGNDQITKVLLSGDYPYLERVKALLSERFTGSIEYMALYEERFHAPGKYADVVGLAIKKY